MRGKKIIISKVKGKVKEINVGVGRGREDRGRQWCVRQYQWPIRPAGGVTGLRDPPRSNINLFQSASPLYSHEHDLRETPRWGLATLTVENSKHDRERASLFSQISIIFPSYFPSPSQPHLAWLFDPIIRPRIKGKTLPVNQEQKASLSRVRTVILIALALLSAAAALAWPGHSRSLWMPWLIWPEMWIIVDLLLLIQWRYRPPSWGSEDGADRQHLFG